MNQNLPFAPCWQRMRDQMPVATTWAYMDHAAVAPLPAPTRDVLVQWSEEAAASGDLAWPQWAERVEAVRALAARLIGAAVDELALVANTTSGISLVAEGLDWQAGDNVVILGNEFPSNQYPWINLGHRQVETRRVAVPDGRVEVELIMRQCDARTRLVAVSWVGFASGWRVDVPALTEQAHARGMLVFLDAIQGLGVFPLDVSSTAVDFLAADGHKWMLGPEGAGICYIRREHVERLRPAVVGWHSMRNPYDFGAIEWDLHPGARRFEGGSQNMAGVLALGASLQWLSDLGYSSTASAVGEQVLAVTDYACARLQQAGARLLSHREGARRSGIVTFDVPGRDAGELRQACLRAGVVLSCRGGGLRISPHAYTNGEDIERLVEAITR